MDKAYLFNIVNELTDRYNSDFLQNSNHTVVMTNLPWILITVYFVFSTTHDNDELFDKIMSGNFSYSAPFWDDMSSSGKVGTPNIIHSYVWTRLVLTLLILKTKNNVILYINFNSSCQLENLHDGHKGDMLS